ncbi:MAG: TonB-dependent receptor plug domain-containing protein, partial [Bacteroidota bacterium]
MKTIHCTLIACFIFSQAIAQSTFKIEGQIVERESKAPLEYATISAFLIADSSLFAGTISDRNGKFQLAVSEDSMFLEVQFLGFEVYHTAIFMTKAQSDLGMIGLSLSSAALEEIEVSGRTVTSSFQLDKQSFDAKQFQNAQGGTASDVLRNLPSVSTNALGEISVRGATGFLVMINGKAIQGDPTLFLQQIPANAIDDIEIVTTPSAKFDPDGMAGIINIVLKKNQKPGWNGTISAGIGTQGQYNG